MNFCLQYNWSNAFYVANIDSKALSVYQPSTLHSLESTGNIKSRIIKHISLQSLNSIPNIFHVNISTFWFQFRGTFSRYIPCFKRNSIRTQRKSLDFKLKVISIKNATQDDDKEEHYRSSKSQSFGTQTPREWESNGISNGIGISISKDEVDYIMAEVDRKIMMISQNISTIDSQCCKMSSSYENKPKNSDWFENVIMSKYFIRFHHFL